MRTIDADALERDGWQMSRTVQIDKKTMEWQTRKPTDFPTIEPQRIHGRWIKTDNGHVEPDAICSHCGFDWMWSDRGYFKFCPNCGADMRGEQNEDDRR